ncbi:MAG: hypothetical protein M3081_18370 [Gemmatimonadota bacterium]|nr:hypothetical protein [Gemmatimonadota bacterium]
MQRMIGQIKRATAIGAFFTLAACAKHSGQQTLEAEAPIPKTYVVIDNQGFVDRNIYIVRSAGTRQKLGFAPGNAKTRFEIPKSLIFGATAISFSADPIGGRGTAYSQSITVQPGDEVVLTVRP